MAQEQNSNFFTDSKIITACLIFLTAAAFTFILKFASSALIPFTISIIIYTIITPFVRLLSAKTRMPRWLSLTIIFTVLTALAVLSVVFIYNSIGSFVAGAGIYTDKVLSTANWAIEFLSKYDVHLDATTITESLNNLPVFNMVKGIGAGLISMTKAIGLILIFLLFLFIGNGSSAKKKEEQPQTVKETQTHQMIKQIQNSISYYIILKTIVSLATGIIVWIILAAFRVELAFMFGFITFFLNFIPNVGSIFAVLLPIPVIFLQFGFGTHFIFVMSLTIGTQFIIGNIIEPQILGDGVDLHPVSVICALLFWTLIWGVVGAFLAVPLTVVIKQVMATIPQTKPVAELLAGRF